MPDFRVTHHGSVVTVRAVSDAAKAFVAENVAVPSWAGSPEHFTTDHRPALMFIEQMQDEGFDVDGL